MKRLKNLTLIAAICLSLTPLSAVASGICSFWTDANGATWGILYENPGGDGAIYAYVDGVKATHYSGLNQRFKVTSKRGAKVTGYNSKLIFKCDK